MGLGVEFSVAISQKCILLFGEQMNRSENYQSYITCKIFFIKNTPWGDI